MQFTYLLLAISAFAAPVLEQSGEALAAKYVARKFLLEGVRNEIVPTLTGLKLEKANKLLAAAQEAFNLASEVNLEKLTAKEAAAHLTKEIKRTTRVMKRIAKIEFENNLASEVDLGKSTAKEGAAHLTKEIEGTTRVMKKIATIGFENEGIWDGMASPSK